MYVRRRKVTHFGTPRNLIGHGTVRHQIILLENFLSVVADKGPGHTAAVVVQKSVVGHRGEIH